MAAVSTREARRKEAELKEARKAGTIMPETDEEGMRRALRAVECLTGSRLRIQPARCSLLAVRGARRCCCGVRALRCT